LSLFALSDHDLAELAASAEDPFFAYSRRTACEGWDRLASILPPRVRLAYAVKANPNAELLRIFAERGASFDCASSGEMERAFKVLEESGAGTESASTGSLFYGGPGKQASEIQRALKLGARVQAESVEDLALVDRLTSKPVAVNLRVHPASGIEEGERIIGGTGPSAFGVDEENLARVLYTAKRYSRVRIEGIHVFAASNERDAAKLARTHQAVMDLARRAALTFSLDLKQIDLGGGLGIAYKPGDTELDITALGKNLSKLIADNPWFTGEFILEPGRWLAGPCGVYVSRVVRVKESRGTRFIILEGGINHLLRPLLTGQPFPTRAFRPDGSAVEGDAGPATLAGPLCTSLDRLGVVDLPAIEDGDLVAFGRAGAYGFTEAMSNFLSHPLPEELWVDA
jgi:diaminopimelate decarboxylase